MVFRLPGLVRRVAVRAGVAKVRAVALRLPGLVRRVAGRAGVAKARAVALRLPGLVARLAEAPRALAGVAIIGIFLLHPLTDFGKSTFTLLPKLEGLAYDARLKLTLPNTGDPQVVIIDIDEASLQRMGRWPWSRDKVAKLTTQLFERYGVRAVLRDRRAGQPARGRAQD